jgi:hypothetical protein
MPCMIAPCRRMLIYFRVIKPFLNVTKGIKRGMRHLGPLVKERLEQEARYGKDWAERPVGTLTPFLVIALTLSYTE